MFKLFLIAFLLALLPLGWWWLRHRGAAARRRFGALAAIALFLTFDLVVFGAFTRLSNSGLGCPDWPGCYGEATPLAAADQIEAAQAAAPEGPVTFPKAWIEMIHRYLAMAVGALILVLAVFAWVGRQVLRGDPWLPTATLVWVLVQGLFGRWTVTLKLYPAIVTLHLLGGLVLLGLLTWIHRRAAMPDAAAPPPLPIPLRRLLQAALALLAVQIALGGWVSSNYAVLACTGFPRCNGEWWPAMDIAGGFTLLRGLGEGAGGQWRTAESLVAIHMVHRATAVLVAMVLTLLAWRLWRRPTTRTAGAVLGALLAAQLASGLSNVILGWPLAAALAHSAGAAALTVLLVDLLARGAGASVVLPVRGAAMAAA